MDFGAGNGPLQVKSPDQLVGRGLKRPGAGCAASSRSEIARPIGRAWIETTRRWFAPRPEPEIARPIGRAWIETHSSSFLAQRVAKSPDQLVGRGLKHQERRVSGPHERREIARPIGRAWIETVIGS